MPTLTSAALRVVPELVGDADAALEWATDVGRWAPKPGSGDTAALWRLLAEVASRDVGVARVLEPHLDALAILDQAGLAAEEVGAEESSSWGVYAAETSDAALIARWGAAGWRLSGEKPWCSLARHVSHALVTARLEDDARALFAVDLRGRGVTAGTGPWVARGLSWIVSAGVRFDGAPAVPVGEPGWYLARPGFAWGGMGVAACWLGGAVGVAQALVEECARRVPDQLMLAHLGAVDTALHGARSVLGAAAAAVDGQDSPDPDLPVLALRTRNLVAHAAEVVLRHVAHALGPAPLALDEHHARRVADLELYLRQHHAERDEAALGQALVEREVPGW